MIFLEEKLYVKMGNSTLNIARQPINFDQMCVLAEILKNPPSDCVEICIGDYSNKIGAVQCLGFAANNLTTESIRILIDALKVNTTVSGLYLMANAIRDIGAELLAELLKSNTPLEALHIQSNLIGHQGIQSVADALKTNTTLQSLDLSYNQVDNEGAIALATALKTNTTLNKLFLRSSQIGDAGIVALTDALKSHPSLIELNLGRNYLSSIGISAVADLLAENPTLVKLVISTSDSIVKIPTALKRNVALTSLVLDGQFGIDDDGVEALSAMLDENTTLTEVDFNFTHSYSNSKRLIRDQIDRKVMRNMRALVDRDTKPACLM
jgi:Ran GTPase-activating protein (RanGAP) involved in mRNA processing and transport